MVQHIRDAVFPQSSCLRKDEEDPSRGEGLPLPNQIDVSSTPPAFGPRD